MTVEDHPGYARLFDEGFSVGLFFPITTSESPIPPLEHQTQRAIMAEELGFDALWVRDVPLYDPHFGDAGQVYDPWVFISHVAAHTNAIPLVTGSVVLPLRHPLHVAKSAASIDCLTDGRLVLGIASGDRPSEFPAFDVDEHDVSHRFRESVRVLRTVWTESYPQLESEFGCLDGSLDVLPKPRTGSIPLLVTGHAKQSLEWIGEHGDGWVYYQRDLADVDHLLERWRACAGGKPYVQVMHVDLQADPSAPPRPIHQGYETGTEWLAQRLGELRDAGVDHVMLNVRHGGRDLDTVLSELADEVLQSL